MSSRWGRSVPAESCPKWMSPTAAPLITGPPSFAGTPVSASRIGLHGVRARSRPGRSRDLLHAWLVAHGRDHRLVVNLVVGQDLSGHHAHRLPPLVGGHLAAEEDLVGHDPDLYAHLGHPVVCGEGL